VGLSPSRAYRFAALRRSHARRALTLMEMMLVVAVLVAVAALVLPPCKALGRPAFAEIGGPDPRSVDQGPGDCDEERTMYVFRYTTGGSEYAVEPCRAMSTPWKRRQPPPCRSPRRCPGRPTSARIRSGSRPAIARWHSVFSGQTQLDTRMAATTAGAAAGSQARPRPPASRSRLCSIRTVHVGRDAVLTNERFFVQVSSAG